jgi:orotidine 5'-phosphate decarboxylase subfamily 1
MEQLKNIIQFKKTNICLSADLTDFNELVKLIDKIGKYICAIKLHSDITNMCPKMCSELSKKYNFMIIDDRKFCDIGNTVALQSDRITKYADFITVHSISGPGVITGLRENCIKNNCKILLIAQMSTSDNLIDEEYTRKTVEMALCNRDVVAGFICQQQLVPKDTGLLHFAPGCQLNTKSDKLGQKYNTPNELLAKGIDVLIVGRGIYAQDDPVKSIQNYINLC